MKKNEATINDVLVIVDDVLQAVNQLSTDMDQKIYGLDKKFNVLQNDVTGIKIDFDQVRGKVNTQMVTKDYLDDKLASLEVSVNHKHLRVDKLVNILKTKKVVTSSEAKIALS